MEVQLQSLLNVANEVIPNLVESYNQSTKEYNQLLTDVERLERENAELAETVQEQNRVLLAQGKSLGELSLKHRDVIRVSNDKITSLEAQVTDLKADLKLLTQLNPKKLEKTNREQKKKLAERQTALDHEKTKLRNANRELKHTQNMLNEQKIGFWRNNTERLIRNLTNKDLTLTNLSIEASMANMVWWQHESGLKVLYGYRQEDGQLYCCDVLDPETGEILQPSYQAVEEMKKHFRKEQR